MTFRLVQELTADAIPVAVTCRTLKVSRAGYDEWLDRAPCARSLADASLTDRIREFHQVSRASYGAPPGPCRTPHGPARPLRPQAGCPADASG